MEIITLVEDKQYDKNLESEHGVSFYIETTKHKILFDVGQSDLFLKNARKLNVNLKDVDLVIISHGHYDHGGGLDKFLALNNQAKIYIQKSAFNDFYSMREKDVYTYIGLDNNLDKSRFIILEGDYVIDDELFILNHIEDNNYFPKSNQSLFKKEDGNMVLDDFKHEQNLLVKTDNCNALFAGCAHRGIVNIINQAEKKIDKQYIKIILGGFHLKSRFKEFEEPTSNIEAIALTLKNKPIEMYYTGHCTGEFAFDVLKNILGERISSFYPGLKIIQ